MNEKYIAHADDTDFEEKVKDLLLYRKIVKAEVMDDQTGKLTLDNGSVLVVKGNEGCGGCGNGWFYLDNLNSCENAITNVECEVEGDYDDCVYRIFVFTEDKRINCVEFSGVDNGYYGTGFDLLVVVADE